MGRSIAGRRGEGGGDLAELAERAIAPAFIQLRCEGSHQRCGKFTERSFGENSISRGKKWPSSLSVCWTLLTRGARTAAHN